MNITLMKIIYSLFLKETDRWVFIIVTGRTDKGKD